MKQWQTLMAVCRFSGRIITRAEDAQGTPSQSHISPSTLVYKDKYRFLALIVQDGSQLTPAQCRTTWQDQNTHPRTACDQLCRIERSSREGHFLVGTLSGPNLLSFRELVVNSLGIVVQIYGI